MSDAHVDIAGLDKASVLFVLVNGTTPPPGTPAEIIAAAHATNTGRREISYAECRDMIERGEADGRVGALDFDYVAGRPVKVDLSGDSFDPWAYDRDAGPGRAAKLVDDLRSSRG